MARGKAKTDTLRFAELSDKIVKMEGAIAKATERLRQIKDERLTILVRTIVGRMEVLHLNYPQTESLLTQLLKGEPTPQQTEKMETVETPTAMTEETEDKTVQLIIRVTAKEKRQIYANMEKANCNSFNHYAKKMLLDGYLIMWTSPEARELKKELGNVNRNLNQLVRRANATGSIYRGDFLDILERWKKIEKETMRFVNEMSRKSE